jgi:hypothetical protein
MCSTKWASPDLSLESKREPLLEQILIDMGALGFLKCVNLIPLEVAFML